MKKNFLTFAALGSLLLWLAAVHAAEPGWGEWQKKDVATEAEKPKASPEPDQKTEAAKTSKTKAETSTPKTPAKAASVSEEVTVLGPPTKGRRITVSSEDDRKMPTPAPKIIVTQGSHSMSKTSVVKAKVEEKLSWWERWKRKRQGIPLKPIAVPDSHVYTVRLQDAKWTVTATRLECKLYQAVPRLGKVMFQQQVGSELEFKVTLNRSYEQIHNASFESMPTTWGHQAHRRDMAIPASIQKSTLTIPREGAIRLINELLEGMAPRMTYRMGSDEASDEVVVTLSSMMFAEKLQVFQNCIDNLLPFKFDEVKESIVFFNYDSSKLTAKAEKALAKVAEYVRLDDKVKRITIEGHTDSKGFRRYNYRLATRRAKAVEKFFLDNGISKSRLQVRSQAYGEKKPVASNKSAKGRAQNRRVHISLFK